MNDTPTPREVQMPLLGRAMGYAAGLKDCHDCFADRAAIVLYDALTDVTEQRDRMAEALQKIRKGITNPTHHRRSTLTIAEDALQSLTTNAKL